MPWKQLFLHIKRNFDQRTWRSVPRFLWGKFYGTLRCDTVHISQDGFHIYFLGHLLHFDYISRQ